MLESIIIGLLTGVFTGYISGCIVTKIYKGKSDNREIKNMLFMLYFYLDLIEKYIAGQDLEKIKDITGSLQVKELFAKLFSLRPKGNLKELILESSNFIEVEIAQYLRSDRPQVKLFEMNKRAFEISKKIWEAREKIKD